ncbi:hypothetical protein ACA910_007666 [Epithemia clementina (nom. ined.)]
MYQTLLRSFWDLDYYLKSDHGPEDLKKIALSDEEWVMIAEAEAVLCSTQILSLDLQTNIPGAVAVSPVLVCFAKAQIPQKNSSPVSGIVKVDRALPPWSGSETLHKNLRTVSKEMQHCKDTTCWLIARLVQEYDNYFKHQSQDDWLAMFCHPFMAYRGISLMVNKAHVATDGKMNAQKIKFIEVVARMIRLPNDPAGTIPVEQQEGANEEQGHENTGDCDEGQYHQ